MSVSQYVGRTIDVLAFQGPVPGGQKLAAQTLALPGKGGQICTGIVKLAQKVLLILLTEKGSIAYRSDRGSDFMTELRLGFVRTQADLLAAFSTALVDIRQQLLAEELTTDPDDERFADAELVGVELNAGKAVVRMRVTSQAGASAEFITPLEVPL